MKCRWCTCKGYCVLFECECDNVGYCGVKS